MRSPDRSRDSRYRRATHEGGRRYACPAGDYTRRMLVDLDSPFNSIPANLDEREAAWLHALRLTCWGAEIAYGRIWEAAQNFTQESPEPGAPDGVRRLAQLSVLAPLSDAWTFIDAAVRVRKLLDRCPLSRVSSELTPLGGPPGSGFDRVRQAYRDASASAVAVRNLGQHAAERLDAHASAKRPMWGLLSLAFHVDREDTTRVVTFCAGIFAEADINVDMPLNEGCALFSAERERVDLRTLYVAIAEVTDYMSVMVTAAIEAHKAKAGIAFGDRGQPPFFPDTAYIRDYTRVPAPPPQSDE